MCASDVIFVFVSDVPAQTCARKGGHVTQVETRILTAVPGTLDFVLFQLC